MIKSLALGALLATGILGYSVTNIKSNTNASAVSVAEAVTSDTVQVNESATIELDVFFMYSNDEGTYWIEPKSEFENVIYIAYEDLEEWGIEIVELSHGNKLTGIFDITGWDLLGLEYIE